MTDSNRFGISPVPYWLPLQGSVLSGQGLGESIGIEPTTHRL
jgi:hypothetical protein